MSEKKYVVPDGMLEAALVRYQEAKGFREYGEPVIKATLEAALRWLSENPIVPNGEQMAALNATAEGTRLDPSFKTTRWYIVEWQRRMFFAPKPEVPVEVEKLMIPTDYGTPSMILDAKIVNERILEAFRRGREGK